MGSLSVSSREEAGARALLAESGPGAVSRGATVGLCVQSFYMEVGSRSTLSPLNSPMLC